MLTTLKKLSGKSVRARIIVAMIIVIGAVAIVNSSVLSLIKGPVVIDENTDFEALDGKYVEYTAKYFLDEYVRQSTRTEGKNDEKLRNIGYLIYDEATGYLFGAELPSKNEQIMNDHIEETWVWMGQESYEVQGSETIRGTWTELTGKRLTYFKETVTDDLGEEFLQIVVPYYIDTNMIGADKKSQTVTCFIFAGVAFLFVLYTLFRYFTNAFDKNLKKFISKNPGVTMEQIDMDFRAAQQVSKHIWVGEHYTIYMSGLYAYIIDNTKLVWAYYYRRTGRNSVSQLRTFNVNKGGQFINCSETEAKKIMEIYAPAQHQMILGYDKNWEKMYNKDFKSFLNLQYYKGMQMRQEAEFTGTADSFGTNPAGTASQAPYTDSSSDTSYSYSEPTAEEPAYDRSEAQPASEIPAAEAETETAFDTSGLTMDTTTSDIGSSFDTDFGSMSSFNEYSTIDPTYGSDSSLDDSSEEEKKED